MSENRLNIESGERLSFYKLFTAKGYHIEIPIIQRDYAHGRTSKLEVRDTFLSAIYQYLEEGEPNRDLDFIYGSIKEGEYSKFIPLDGQQRLTTLFLIHWYLALASENFEDFKNVLGIKKGETYKSKFTYETRTSSREFCDELIAKEITLEKLLAPDKNKRNELSKTIRNMGWFYRSWDNDPTIKSMLNMLDAIHLKFKLRPDFYLKLTEDNVITFQFLNLQEFKLSDDLYIKMNARGKPLTAFENFKAKFEQYLIILDKDKKNERGFVLNFEGNEKEVSLKEYFSHKIDVEWTNLFWNYKDIIEQKKDEDEGVDYDDELMNLIRVLFTNDYASNEEADSNLEYLVGIQKARKIEGYSDVISFNKYRELNSLSVESIYSLIDAIDSLYNGGNKIKIHLEDTFYFDEADTFEKVLSFELSFPKRVQFYAYIQYLIQKSEELSGLHQWMRFVHNMTENTIIDSVSLYVDAINFVDECLPISNTILNSINNTIPSINKRQLDEEIVKALLINKSNDWKKTIEASEKKVFFKGQIGFVLEFSNILTHYNEFQNCNWCDEEDIIYLNSFNHYSRNATALFEMYDTKSNTEFIVQRAILSKGDYLISASSNRFNFISSKSVKNYERDFSWKRLLRVDLKEDKVWKSKRECVKNVFDDITFEAENVVDSLTKIHEKSTVTDWRKYFIENPELIRYCGQGYINKETDNDIILLGSSQLNHYHLELFSSVLSLNSNKFIADFLPFKECSSVPVKSSWEHSFALFSGYIVNRDEFRIEVYYDHKKEFLPNSYQIRFYTQNNIQFDKYPQFIKEIAAKLDMIPKDEDHWYGYWQSFETEEKAIIGIKEICSKLN
jgi:hypothetical protein